MNRDNLYINASTQKKNAKPAKDLELRLPLRALRLHCGEKPTAKTTQSKFDLVVIAVEVLYFSHAK